MVPDKQNVIESNNLTAKYGVRTVWSDADFKIGSGQFVAVLGPNGAGKTTLFKMILGLIKPYDGQLLVFGQQPRRGEPRISYVPQRHLIDREVKLEALQLVKLGIDGANWGMGKPSSAAINNSKALKALTDVDAKKLAHQPLGLLSGGELQRVFLAQALAAQPQILLLDEPLANLDIRRQSDFIQLISKIARSKDVTVLLIAHDINPLLPVMDSVIYMANGKVATGKPDEIISSAALSKLYGTPVEVLKDSHGRVAVLGVEEAAHPHG